MASVLIVRPFGRKSVLIKDQNGNDASVEVDFEQIDRSCRFQLKRDRQKPGGQAAISAGTE
jgi:hypothetical protein